MTAQIVPLSKALAEFQARTGLDVVILPDDARIAREIEQLFDTSTSCPGCWGDGRLVVRSYPHVEFVDCPDCDGSGVTTC